MPSGTYNETFVFPGYGFASDRTPVAFDHPNPFEIPLPAGKAITTWVKTDNDTGVATLGAGHGIVTSDKVDVYWPTGNVRYGLTATVSGNDVTVDGGAGDNFPASSTANMVLCKQVPIVTYIDGDAIKIIGILYYNPTDANGVGHVDMQDSGNVTIAQLDLVDRTKALGYQHIYDIANGETNVFTGNVITQTKASNGSSSGAATLYILSGEDSTP